MKHKMLHQTILTSAMEMIFIVCVKLHYMIGIIFILLIFKIKQKLWKYFELGLGYLK